MKLNCDLGESFGAWRMGSDAEAMPWLHQANIACGFHAGDPVVMARTLALAGKFRVSIGAHPSYPDLAGFGRRSMQLSADELYHSLHYQIAALDGMAQAQGLAVDYVKPHGALYNDMMQDAGIRATIMQAVKDYPAELGLMLQGSPQASLHQQEAAELSLALQFEAFADRRYTDDGRLVSRRQPDAILTADETLAQVTRLLSGGGIISQQGAVLSFPVDSLCVHGDNDTSIRLIRQIREQVEQHAH